MPKKTQLDAAAESLFHAAETISTLRGQIAELKEALRHWIPGFPLEHEQGIWKVWKEHMDLLRRLK